jgi:hypothetical protein
MKLSEQIEHLEHNWCLSSETPWQNWSRSRKSYKKMQHKVWRHYSKHNLEEDSLNPTYNRYAGWEW